MDEGMKRNSVAKGAVLLAIGVIVIVAAIAYVLMTPDVWDKIINIAIVIIVAIVAVVLIIIAVMAILAVPMYAYKGEQYQSDKSYDLDDVEPVKEKDSHSGDTKKD